MYSAKAFDTLIVDKTTDPELAKFVNQTISKGPKFSNYTAEKLNEFVNRIYELRKDNSNNTAR